MTRIALLALALCSVAAVERDPTGDLTDRDDRADLPPPDRGRVVVTDSGPLLIVLEPISFAAGSAVIEPAQRAMIAAVAETFAAMPDITRVGIEGHADRGEHDPIGLGRARAAAVVAALAAQGVRAYRLRAETRGDREPVDRSPWPDAQAKNRRVDFVILARTQR